MLLASCCAGKTCGAHFVFESEAQLPVKIWYGYELRTSYRSERDQGSAPQVTHPFRLLALA